MQVVIFGQDEREVIRGYQRAHQIVKIFSMFSTLSAMHYKSS